MWVVFCVHDDNEAFLEMYNDTKSSMTHKPEWFVSLMHTNHVSPTICPNEQEYEFVVTLASEVVRLAAPTWDQMLDWVESLRSKLEELRILSPKENLYSKLPENKGICLLPTRDPTSPLPPPPAIPPALVPGVEALNIRESDSSNYYLRYVAKTCVKFIPSQILHKKTIIHLLIPFRIQILHLYLII